MHYVVTGFVRELLHTEAYEAQDEGYNVPSVYVGVCVREREQPETKTPSHPGPPRGYPFAYYLYARFKLRKWMAIGQVKW